MSERPPIAPESRTTSPSLYIGAGIAQVMGLLVVRYQVSDSGFTIFLIGLALVSLACAYYLRGRGLSARLVPLGAALGLMLFFALAGGGSAFLESIPPEAAGGNQVSLLLALAITATLTNFLAVTDDAVLFSTVWVIAIIGLAGSQDLNLELVICFLVFLLTASFLLIHQNYLQQTKSNSKRISIPISLLKIQGLTALAAWFAAVVLGTALAIPFRMIGRGISLRQVIEQLSLPPSATASSRFRARRSGLQFDNREEFRVGVGSVPDDNTLVLKVESPGPRFWRGRTFGYYTGAGWQNNIVARGTPLAGKPESGPDRKLGTLRFPARLPTDPNRAGVRIERHRFYPQVSMVGSLYHAAEPIAVVGNFDGVFRRFDGTLGGGTLANQPYWIEAEVSKATEAELNATPKSYPNAIKGAYTAIDRPDPRIAKLADEAVGKKTKPFEMAEAIRSFVGNRAMYNLNAEAVPVGADAVDFFLNQSHEGYCDLFATATTLLCRYKGLPSRVATGFNSGTPDPTKPGRFLLTNNNRHAWTEVYFAGYGWIPFDATALTAATNEAPAPTIPSKVISLKEKILAAVPIVLIGLGALGVGFVVVAELRRNPLSRPTAVRVEVSPATRTVVRTYNAALRQSAKKGVKRTPAMTGREHLDAVRIKLGDETARALEPLLTVADDALFSPYAATAADIASAKQHLKNYRSTLSKVKKSVGNAP